MLIMSTSSEKYETLQDEVDSLIQRIQEAIRSTEAASGEEKKMLAQVSEGRFISSQICNRQWQSKSFLHFRVAPQCLGR